MNQHLHRCSLEKGVPYLETSRSGIAPKTPRYKETHSLQYLW